VLTVDIDEFVIILTKNTTITNFVHHLSSKNQEKLIHGVSIQSTFVGDRFTLEPDLTKITRKIFPHRERSKTLVRPDFVQKIGIHEVFRYETSEFNEIKLPANEGLIFHRRNE